MIRALGFIDVAAVSATYTTKYRTRLQEGVLMLRDTDTEDALQPIVDMPVLEEWKSAKSLLARLRNQTRDILKTQADLGKAWIETLPGGHATPWRCHEDDYAQAHIRLRICLIPAPDAFTYSGHFREMLGYGVVNLVEHRILHCDTNFGAYPRVHLVVDVERPADADPVN